MELKVNKSDQTTLGSTLGKAAALGSFKMAGASRALIYCSKRSGSSDWLWRVFHTFNFILCMRYKKQQQTWRERKQ